MNQTFSQFIYQFSPIVNGIIALLSGVAILVFMAGLARYIFNISGDTKKIQEGKELILWGLISLFILFALGGILNFFAVDFFGKTVSSGGSSAQPPAAPAGSPDAGFNFSSPGVQTDSGGVDLSTGGVAPGEGVSPGGGIQEGNGIQGGPGVQTATSGSAFQFGGYVTPRQ